MDFVRCMLNFSLNRDKTLIPEVSFLLYVYALSMMMVDYVVYVYNMVFKVWMHEYSKQQSVLYQSARLYYRCKKNMNITKRKYNIRFCFYLYKIIFDVHKLMHDKLMAYIQVVCLYFITKKKMYFSKKKNQHYKRDHES